VIAERVVLRGSSTSSNAADGSPRQSAPTLSTSSSRITGFIVPASRSARTSPAGSEPMYVRRCADLRLVRCRERHAHELAFNALATDSPIDVLPCRRPISVRIAPLRLSFGDARVLAQLAHREVLDDAVFRSSSL